MTTRSWPRRGRRRAASPPGPTRAYGAVRRLLGAQGGATLTEQLDAELEAIVEARGHADAQEGVAAFLARRPPRFAGR